MTIHKVDTYAVTLVRATAPSSVDASLVPRVNRRSFGSCLWTALSNFDSSNEANTGTLVPGQTSDAAFFVGEILKRFFF